MVQMLILNYNKVLSTPDNNCDMVLIWNIKKERTMI